MSEPRELWKHQKLAVEKAEKLNNFGYFFEPGSGKTATVIHTLRHKFNEHKKILKTIVLCPPIVIENWKNEFLLNSKIPPEKITCLYGTGKQRLKLFKERSESGHIFITNYETLQMDVFEEMCKWGVEAVVVDECHRVANYTSKRSKNVEKLVNGNMLYDKRKQVYSGPRPYVYILSGSPILNSPMDIFQQYKILDAGATFGANFIGFRARYFRDKNQGMPKHNYFPNWVPIAGALEEIGEKLNRNSMRVLKKDCMDLPPLIRKVIKVEMSGEQKKLYDSMVEDYVAYFTRDGKEEVTTATMGMTKGIRLMQISSGYIKTVDGAEVDICEKYNPKQDALYSLLEDLTPNHKVIIWAVWIQNYEQIRRVLRDLKLDWLEINGLNGADKNRANAKEFEANSKIRVLIAHPESGGEGINLVSASYAITYSRTYSLRQDIQAEARNYRGGSEVHEKVTRIDLVSKDTIEEKILEMLANKQEVGDKVLRDITLQSYKKEKS